MSASNKTKRSYPRGLFLVSIVNAGNMVALAMINALLVLYCTHQLNISLTNSYATYAAFGAIFYAGSLLGGYLGGKYDYKLAIILGCVLASAGGYMLASGEISAMYSGLAAFIVGCGLIVPNLYCLIGKLYAKDDHKRDSGFTIAYMLTNLGGMLSAFSSGFLVNQWGFHTAFFIASSVLLASLLLFVFSYKRFHFYSDEKHKAYKADMGWKNFFPMFLTLVVAVPIIRVLLNYATTSNIILIILGIAMILFVVYLALQEKGKSRKKMFVFLIFIIIGTVFWALYMLAPSALTIFIQNNVNRKIGGFTIPTSSLYGLNPLFIITLGFITSTFFLWLAKRKKSLSIPTKFSIGIICMGLGYISLFVGIYLVGKSGYTAIWWVIVSYLFQSLGELFIGPISLAMVGTLCPAHLEGFMMGFFRLSTGVAGAVSGFLAQATSVPKSLASNITFTNHVFSHAFGLYGTLTLIVGLTVLALVPQFKKIWN